MNLELKTYKPEYQTPEDCPEFRNTQRTTLHELHHMLYKMDVDPFQRRIQMQDILSWEETQQYHYGQARLAAFEAREECICGERAKRKRTWDDEEEKHCATKVY